jgi:aldehyde dehydrogenase (NAD+)
LAGGYFYLPTIFDRVEPGTRLAQEEIFGPVLSLLDYDDDEQLVTDANGTVFGLAAGIWTEDMRRALTLAERLKAGTVWINTFRQTQISASFGGYKMSGIGREKGLSGLEEYCEEKTVWVDLNDKGIGYFDD